MPAGGSIVASVSLIARGSSGMIDITMIAAGTGFFFAALLYAVACERM